MRVLLSNNTGSKAKHLNEMFPDMVGHLIGPGGYRRPFPWYSIDNGRFASWAHGTSWDEKAFRSLLEKARGCQWVVVPDVVGDMDLTMREWDRWAPRLESEGFRLAMACQDGMEPRMVPDGVVAFVGGTMDWKLKVIDWFASECERVHVGRINRERLLWYCDECGVESVDGTGWFRGNVRQLASLERYLTRKAAGLGRWQPMLF